MNQLYHHLIEMSEHGVEQHHITPMLNWDLGYLGLPFNYYFNFTLGYELYSIST